VAEMKTRTSELLRQAAVSVNITQTSLSLTTSHHRAVSRYTSSLATDVAVIDGYNASAHLVCMPLWCLLR